MSGQFVRSEETEGFLTVLIVQVAVNPANLVANSEGNTDVAVTGVDTGQKVMGVQVPADLDAGLVLKSCTVLSNGNLRFVIRNVTAAAIDGASRTYQVMLVRERTP